MAEDRERKEKKGDACIVIPLKMYDNVYFMNWLSSSEAKVWRRMFRYAVRGEMPTDLDKLLLKEFYFGKNKIVTSNSPKKVADFYGFKDESGVSKLVKSMIKKGIIIEHHLVWRGRRRRIYEFGYHSGGKLRKENLHLLDYFEKIRIDKEYEERFTIEK